jgi:CheY-like chemotaxis protein
MIESPARRTQGRNGNRLPLCSVIEFKAVVTHQSGREAMTTKLDGTGRKILVIDDDVAIRVLLQAVLNRMKFQVELAEDGAVGLEKLQQNGTFDLVLLDLMMPRINGYEFIETVSRDFPQLKPHIIVFTAAGRRGVEKIPANAVCNSILKPFDLEKFIEMISDCLDSKHPAH